MALPTRTPRRPGRRHAPLPPPLERLTIVPCLRRFLPLVLLLTSALEPSAPAAAATALALKSDVAVDGQGIYLSQLASQATGASLPALKLGDAPALGQQTILTREQIGRHLEQAAPAFVPTHWVGALQVRITRRSRNLAEDELAELLTAALQRDLLSESVELELTLARSWNVMAVPDDPLTVRLIHLPPAGVTPTMPLRFQLLAGDEPLGTWQTVVRARLYREVLVAQTALRRGQSVAAADFRHERRDVLALRDALAELPDRTDQLQLAESLAPGAPLLVRALQSRTVIRRGATIEALFIEGPLSISLKVEALENGAAGQTVRVRNPRSGKQFTGTVRDEQTIVVSM
ncbi:MAG: flagellar basal body P-ring formation protein FlgA [Verrucomicrobia bacterium]|nr:flagellar basal body P-ring formation protein FlgA [Verrucomicrobiota bacterium]